MCGARIAVRFRRLLGSLLLLWGVIPLGPTAIAAMEIGSYRPMIGAEDPIIQGWGPHNVGMDFYEVRYETLTPIEHVDFNDNDVVDVADYTVWRDGLGQPGTAADANGNGRIDRQDYAMWKINYGRGSSVNHGAGLSVAVPEAGTAVLLALSLAAWWSTRPRHGNSFA